MALGADDYITKPFSEKDILEAIAARTHRQRSLRERVDELVEQRRRQAGADWSHELLTPLNGMLGGLQLLELEAETMSREQLREMIALIRGGVERQEKLSRQLIRFFELERIRDGHHTGESYRGRADIAILAGAQRALAGSSRDRDVDLQYEPATVPLPEHYLVDGVAELVSNAVRFSSPGQKVTVQGLREAGGYVIEVTDQGPGMTAEERAAVAPFTQFGRAKREQQGLGLGLAIARLVAQVAGGTLRLENGPGGRGLRCTLTLPTI
jgi:signal transduction histidine kinase